MSQDLLAPGRLRVGPNLQDSDNPRVRFIGTDDDTTDTRSERYSADATGPRIILRKARGTPTASGDVVAGDNILRIVGQVKSTSFFNTAAIHFHVDAAVVAGQRPASRIEFYTNENNAAQRTVAYMSREGYLGIGTAFAPDTAATRAAYPLHIVSSGTGAELFVTAESYDTTANATFRAGRARGTFAAPAIVQAGDILGEYEFYGYTNQWHHCAEMISVVMGTPAAGVVPDSDLQFLTTESGSLTIRARIIPDGTLLLGAAAFQSEADINTHKKGKIWIANNSNTDMICIQFSANNSNSPAFYFAKSRGTIAAPATVQTGDEMMYLQGRAYTNQWHDNVGAIRIRIAGTVTAGQRPGNDITLRTGQPNAGGPSDRVLVDQNGNVGINTSSFGASSQGVMGVGNAAVVPTGNPTGGGVLYAEGGAGKWRGSGGTITTFGPADPHCPVCGQDFGHEWERTPDVEPDPAKRYMAVCLPCLVAHVDSLDGGRPKPFVRRQKPIVIVPPAEPGKPPEQERPPSPPEPPGPIGPIRS